MSFEDKYRKSARSSAGIAAPALPAIETLKAAAATSEDEYRAFYPQTQPQFDLWIRPNKDNTSPATALPYSRRACMIVDDGYFLITMQFESGPVLGVRLHGRNLQELFLKLLAHEVVYVREYDARKWPEVPEGEACITGIDIRYRPAPGKDTAPADIASSEPEKATTH